MNVLTIIKTLALCATLALSLVACSNFDNASSEFPFSKNGISTSFNKDYLISTPWYGVATSSNTTQCLSKFVFWENEVVSATHYHNEDGVSLETEDLIFSINPDIRISIANRYFYNYQSHGKQFFITLEAHFFRDYDEALRYAEENGIDCKNSFPA